MGHEYRGRCVEIADTSGDGPLVVCFPFAGGSADAYHPWLETVPPEVVRVLVHLPGGLRRFHLPPVPDLRSAARQVVTELTDALASTRGPRATVFVGHSMGAVLAYEAALLTPPSVGPLHLRGLVVGGCPAPHRWDPGPGASGSDDELAAMLVRWGGTPEAVLDTPELAELVLASLRRDLALCAAYRRDEPPRLSVPVVALAGRDDPDVGVDDVAQWAQVTDRWSVLRVLSGGHFFIADHGYVLGESVGSLLTHSASAHPPVEGP